MGDNHCTTTVRGAKMAAITLIEMTDYETCATVYVNPANIASVSGRQVKEGVATDVHFVGGEYLSMHGCMERSQDYAGRSCEV